MKIFIDTADLSEIRRATEAGLIDGLTTNPSLMAKSASGKDPAAHFREICELVNGPVSAEVVAVDARTMVEEGKRLAGIHPNVVVKVPVTENGLRACRALRQQDIRVNVTLCFQASQALLAAKAGATYISPFIGRLDDVSEDGMQLIQQIREIYDNYAIDTEILAASIRHPVHVVDAARIGADCATMPPKVLWQLLEHPLTDKGLAQFLEDWKKLGKEI
jgi:transaldolase